jgi:hypothetical protein
MFASDLTDGTDSGFDNGSGLRVICAWQRAGYKGSTDYGARILRAARAGYDGPQF